MHQTNTLNFRLRLERKLGPIIGCLGNYYIDLSGESPFNLNKSFDERFFTNSEGTPFYTLEDAAQFAEEMAAFWKFQLMSNPKLGITAVEELADLWRKFATELYPNYKGVPRQPVYKF
jgi:hypothetical protein